MSIWPQKSAKSSWLVFWSYATLFVISGLVSLLIQAVPAFRDPDTFYHLKMAMLMREQGIIQDFTWLPFTTLAKDFADHHFLYHLLLIPFISVFGSLHGMIIATAVFSATALTTFYALLRAHAVKWPEAFVFILGTASAFAFRVNLGKAGALSLAAIFLALIAIRKGKPFALFLISFLYVWLHGGWPIMLVVVVVALHSKIIADRILQRHPWHSWAHGWFWRRLFSGSRHARSHFFSSIETRTAASAVCGLVAGLVVNPYFPGNLKFYWEQIVQIAVVGHGDTIGVGSEWYPYPFSDLLTNSAGPFLAILISLTLLGFVLFWPELVKRGRGAISSMEISPIATSWTLAFLFLALTLRSKRHVEYLVPFMVLAAALLTTAVVSRMDANKAQQKLADILPKKKWVAPALLTWLGAVLLYVGIRDVVVVRDLFQKGEPFGKYAPSASWILAHAPQDAVIMHSDWDDFPILFFRDSKHRYIAGLDATFLYRADRAKYFLWRDITTGKLTNSVAGAVRDSFGARHVFIENDHTAMIRAFEADKEAIKVYYDAEATVFIIL